MSSLSQAAVDIEPIIWQQITKHKIIIEFHTNSINMTDTNGF